MCYSMFIPGKTVGLCIFCHPQKPIICNCPLPCIIISPSLVRDLQGCRLLQLMLHLTKFVKAALLTRSTCKGLFRVNTRSVCRHAYLESAMFQISSRCTFPTSMESYLPTNNRKMKHNPLSTVWELVTQTGNHLQPFVLLFL